MTTTDMVPRPYALPAVMSDSEIERTFRIAKALALSSFFKDAKGADQAFSKILLGRDLGLTPAQAMTGIHIVEGKPQVAAVTLASFVQRLPEYDYRVRELDDQKCTIEFLRGEDSLGVSTFTMEDAQRAGLVRTASPWQKHPRNMLFARAMSNGVKWFVPEATGGIPVYHEGEIEQRAELTAESDEAALWGEDEQLALELREAFDALGFQRAKVRMLLRGCADDDARRELLANLKVEAELPEVEAADPPEAEVVA